MTKRIFKYMELIIVLTLISGFVAVLLLLYSNFKSVQQNQLKAETNFAAKAVESQGMDYLSSLNIKNTRVTWIASDGKVLFDSKADPSSMGNHASRPEVKEAMESGDGESTRFSNTLTTEMIYSAKRLSDGSVLRIAESRNSVLMIALGMLQPMIWIFLILLLVTWFISGRMAKQIISPLNKFDLDHPLENEEYPELAPFLHRIHVQQQEIGMQKESLERAEKDFVTVTGRMKECLILLSWDGKILTINQQAMNLLHADDSCVGRDVLFLERRSEFERALNKAAEGEHSELIMDFSGRKYQTDISPVPFDNSDKTAGMVILMFDVTDRENAELMRREFTSNVSHELKTPLHTISGCAELLEKGNVRMEDTQKFVHVIYGQVQRMISLVEDILYISHLDEGSIDMSWDNIDLKQMAERIADQLRPEAEKRPVTISVSGSAPAVPGIYRLNESIIHNLIENAIKYNKDNGEIHVELKEEKDTVTLSVRDTGIGIPEEDQSRIFERFYRVDKSHSREIGGTGLGLSIVKHAAELLHAELKLESRLGEGSTFTVAFRKSQPLS